MKILIVDDNEDSRIILKKTLQHDGYTVEEAPNGAEALKLAKKSPPDMIISDILMPVMDGFRLCRKVKQNEKLKHIPFIFYTSTYTDPKNEKLAMSLGATRYIVKPIGIDEFLTIIREISRQFKDHPPHTVKTIPAKDADLLKMYEESIVEKLDKKIRELQLYKEIFANSNDAIFVLDTQGHIIRQNSAHRVLIGYTEEELQGETPALYLGNKVYSEIRKRLSLMGVYLGDVVAHTRDRAEVQLELSAFSIADEKGKVICNVGIERDITKRKQAEMEIRRQSENLKIINTIIRDVSSTLELKDVLHKITKSAAELINGDGASIAILDEENQVITYPYHYNMPESLTDVIARKGRGLASQVLETEQSLIINDYPSHPKALKEFSDAGLKVLIAVPLVSRGRAFGAIGVFGLTSQKRFTEQDMDLLESVGKQAAIAIENASLYENLEQMFINTITSLASIMDAKSPWTKGHAERVTHYALAIGKQIGLDDEALETVRLGGLLHDIGKIGTYDMILEKPSTLTPDELELIHEHPLKGAEILEPIKQLKEIVPLVKYHHEKVDGTGYPDGLKGSEIPLLAKILCVADAYDSLIADRPYRRSTKKQAAIEEIRRCSGTHFDPAVVDAFLKVVRSGEFAVS